MTQLPAADEYQPSSYWAWGQGQPREHCVGTSCDNLVSMGAQQAQVSKGGGGAATATAAALWGPPLGTAQWSLCCLLRCWKGLAPACSIQ